MSMKKLIDEISVIPGVTGSCIFDRTEGPLCTDSEANIATEVLQKVGSYLIRMLKMGSMNGLDISTSHFRFDNCTVVGMPLDSGSILLTVCDTQANCSLVATTAAMLAADMREDLEREVVAERNAADDEADFEELDMVEEAPVDSYMQGYLDQMEEALAGAIGPVAGMVIQDYIVKWQQGGPVVTTRLNELAEMLADEIGDETLASEFMDKVKKLI